MTYNRVLSLLAGVATYLDKPITGAVQVSDGWVELVDRGSLLQVKAPRTVAVLEMVDPWVREHVELPADLQAIVGEHLARKAAFDGRIEGRRDRYEERAAKKRQESDAYYKRSSGAVAGIPFGQPILVGHHSERRHRNAIARSAKAMDKSVESSRQADYLAGKAKSVGRAGVSSDDPDGRFKLQEKLAKMEADQELWKATNKALKLKKGSDEALSKLGYKDEQIQELRTPDFAGRTGIPAYMLQNNNANMRRIRQRIEELTAANEREDFTHAYGDIVLELDTTDNRVRLKFDGKPAPEVRQQLNQNGFKWSRDNEAWQRKATQAGVNVAERFAQAISGESTPFDMTGH